LTLLVLLLVLLMRCAVKVLLQKCNKMGRLLVSTCCVACCPLGCPAAPLWPVAPVNLVPFVCSLAFVGKLTLLGPVVSEVLADILN
jgi:hypothetical protein